ncbi:ligninase H2 precursor [Metarhizium rileyi]|uniref:Peroxidase n=1 Tax=Metarhizium rileyi (strain RCEF 4871) TaxID=1649241 RepID=A0A167E4E8_METRR|nr:ligninase H2 precursor [Metarhizium rileyi RCEF 4871]
MKATIVILLSVCSVANAFPGMPDLLRNLPRAQEDENLKKLPCDLEGQDESTMSETGKLIKNILEGKANAQDATTSYSSVPNADSAECKADKCCIWKHIADEMKSKMTGDAGRCNNLARQCIRMGFHDAATWSLGTGKGGGVDGSLVLARECVDRQVNKALTIGCSQMQTWYDKYKSFGVGMADLIQMGANVATVVCPLGPRIRSFVGRKDSSDAAPDGLLPSPFDSADQLISMFSNKTISPNQLVALIGAHTTSQQVFVNTSRPGDPQDSTPGVWDTNFYGETTDANAPKRIFKFQSDINLSQDPRASGAWKAFTGTAGQRPWNGAYAQAYMRLSMMGVYNTNDLTECTKALPLPVTSFSAPDAQALAAFANGSGGSDASKNASQGDIVVNHG